MMENVYLAAADAHSLKDIQSLPWWAQLLVGAGLTAASVTSGYLADKWDSLLLGILTFFFGIAALIIVYGALFG
jgi:hypothetical protein